GDPRAGGGVGRDLAADAVGALGLEVPDVQLADTAEEVNQDAGAGPAERSVARRRGGAGSRLTQERAQPAGKADAQPVAARQSPAQVRGSAGDPHLASSSSWGRIPILLRFSRFEILRAIIAFSRAG